MNECPLTNANTLFYTIKISPSYFKIINQLNTEKRDSNTPHNLPFGLVALIHGPFLLVEQSPKIRNLLSEESMAPPAKRVVCYCL